MTACRSETEPHSFLEHYGRWVLLDSEGDPKALLRTISRSPLLLCACFLIAVRHTTEALANSLAPKLYQYARSLISAALLVAPQPIEFFQAALVLSMWSTTVGQVPLSIDSWLLSGFSLQHSQSSPLFDPVNNAGPATQLSKTTLDNWCLWNHLCLVHLHYCVGTSRQSMLHASQIARCRAVLGSDHATNYELRMVAEIYLYWAVYENISSNALDLLKSLARLQDWKKEWQFVLCMLPNHRLTGPMLTTQCNHARNSSSWAFISPISFSTTNPSKQKPPEPVNRCFRR